MEQLKTHTTEFILAEIKRLQDIQKITPPSKPEWQDAHEQIEALCAEMARRTN